VEDKIMDLFFRGALPLTTAPVDVLFIRFLADSGFLNSWVLE
jgi:hypothetical protein